MSNRYKFYGTPGPSIICVSSYAGKKIRRVATCSENDTYDYEKGCSLAKAKVDVEVARRRSINADNRCREAWKKYSEAEEYYDKMVNYADDADREYESAQIRLKELLETM